MSVVLNKDGHIGHIVLDRPASRNAFDADMVKQMRAVLVEFEQDRDIRVGIISGTGKGFCAGMDLAAFGAGAAREIVRGEGRFAGFVAAERSKPIIAAVHGAAVAGGLEILLACDLAIAAEGTIFALTETKRGLIAGGGGTFRLTRRIPHVIANEMLLTGDPITADRALHYGMINAVVPLDELLNHARALADRIAANAPMAVRHSLAQSRQARDGLEEADWKMNDRLWMEIEFSDDAVEGAKAFIEKREPVWTGC